MKKEEDKKSMGLNHQFKKSLGQNFISDPNLILSIIRDAGVTKDDVVVEVGAGAGSLTGALCMHAKNVLSFEVDTSLSEQLHEIEKENPNLKVVFKDIMKVSEDEISTLLEKYFNHTGNYKLVANIPYYITSPIILKFLASSHTTSIMVMVQKEVAERITSAPGSKEYGAISVLIQALSNPSLTRVVKKHNFFPVPKVDSALLKIEKKETGLTEAEKEKFAKIIQKCFSSRRKTLVNNLMQGLGFSRQEAEEKVLAAGHPLTIRPEQLSPEDFIYLSKLV